MEGPRFCNQNECEDYIREIDLKINELEKIVERLSNSLNRIMNRCNSFEPIDTNHLLKSIKLDATTALMIGKSGKLNER